MRKISEMYRWSGGTDYRHTCYECGNCIRQAAGKREIYKCKAYGITDGSETDWNEANIACKHYGKPVPKPPVFFQGREVKRKDQIEGQMNIMEFLK